MNITQNIGPNDPEKSLKIVARMASNAVKKQLAGYKDAFKIRDQLKIQEELYWTERQKNCKHHCINDYGNCTSCGKSI